MTLAFRFPNRLDSPISRMDARWKLACMLPAALIVGCLRSWPTVLAALTGALLLAFLSRLPLRWFLSRVVGTALFLLFFVIWLPLLPMHAEETINVFGLTLSPSGLERAGVILGKGVTIVTLILVLLATSPLPETLKAAHALCVPALVIHLALLTFRYIFLFADEFIRLRIALRVRGFRNRANFHSYRTAAHAAGTLLVRSHERAERVGQAMRCRGFDGEFRSLGEFQTAVWDVIGFALIMTTALAILLVDMMH